MFETFLLSFFLELWVSHDTQPNDHHSFYNLYKVKSHIFDTNLCRLALISYCALFLYEIPLGIFSSFWFHKYCRRTWNLCEPQCGSSDYPSESFCNHILDIILHFLQYHYLSSFSPDASLSLIIPSLTSIRFKNLSFKIFWKYFDDRQTDGPTDWPTDGPTDRQSHP